MKCPRPSVVWRWLVTQLCWRVRFGSLGRRAILFRPLLVSGARRIHIGQRTTIRDMARLEVLERDGTAWSPRLSIGDRVNIEQGVHIVCQGTLTIGNDVSVAPYCAIVDTYHPYDPPDGSTKIGARLPDQPTFVTIGDGCFIGAHSMILPGVRLGRCCMIGAGSVVTRDVPDFAVAAGVPARVTKIYDPASKTWNTGGRNDK